MKIIFYIIILFLLCLNRETMKDNVYQRIKQIIEDKGLSVRQFERLCDFSNRYVKSLEKSSPTLESLEKILATFPDVDRHWLLTGEWEDKGRVEETRPRIPTSVAAGSLMGFADAIKSYDCEMQPVVKNFPTYDYTIIIKGDSMEPKFEGGDEVAIKKVTSFIEWGKAYVLDTRDGAVIKRLFDEGDSFRCVSYNKDYPDFLVSKADVFGIYKVVGLLRF